LADADRSRVKFDIVLIRTNNALNIISMLLDPIYVRERLIELKSLDRELQLFGAEGHQYQLNPLMSEADVADYERQQSISIPEDYRHFITEIGNGGAGPFLGVVGLPPEWQWDMASPFLYTQYTQDVSDSAKLIDELDESDESDENYDEIYERLSLKYWTETNGNGAIEICGYGCALSFYLVLNGSERGNIWFNATADFNGFSPVTLNRSESHDKQWCSFGKDTSERISFGKWYEAWLDWSIQFSTQFRQD
jgi:hypothetical protein